MTGPFRASVAEIVVVFVLILNRLARKGVCVKTNFKVLGGHSILLGKY